MLKPFEVISAILLVAGTCIGGGMLALPLGTGLSGFVPSMCMMFLTCVMMASTGLMLIEASLWMEGEVHMISMVEALLGTWAKRLCWVVYLFICYGSIMAYTAAGGFMISGISEVLFNLALSQPIACALFIIVFGLVVDLGARWVGRFNAILMVALIAAYVIIVYTGLPNIQKENLLYQRWSYSLMGIPLLLTSFSFQTMAPSLTPLLKRHAGALKMAVIGGSFLTFFIYFFWESVVLGMVPAIGEGGLLEALHSGSTATPYVIQRAPSVLLANAIAYFEIFAIITSFLGIALGLYDFLADGLKIPKRGVGKLKLALLIIVPTLIMTLSVRNIFLVALDLTGGFGDTVLNGMIPVCMVWVGRYAQKREGPLKVFGGKGYLALVFLFFAGAFLMELFTQFGWLRSLYQI